MRPGVEVTRVKKELAKGEAGALSTPRPQSPFLAPFEAFELDQVPRVGDTVKCWGMGAVSTRDCNANAWAMRWAAALVGQDPARKKGPRATALCPLGLGSGET